MAETATKQPFRPKVVGASQISTQQFAFVNSDKSVRIMERHRGISPDSYVLRGFVESSKKGGSYFYVKERISRNNNITEASCTCTSAHFFGNPCSHALKMRNAYVKHKKEIRTGVLKSESRK